MRSSLVIIAVCVAILVQGCETPNEYYPPSYGKLILGENDKCPDISGTYKPSFILLRLVNSAKEGRTVNKFNAGDADLVEFKNHGDREINYKFSKNSNIVYSGALSKASEYKCKEGMAALRYESVAMSLTPGVVGFGTDTFFLAKTDEDNLVAKRVIKGTPMLLILPLPGGKHEVSWFRWKSVEHSPNQ